MVVVSGSIGMAFSSIDPNGGFEWLVTTETLAYPALSSGTGRIYNARQALAGLGAPAQALYAHQIAALSAFAIGSAITTAVPPPHTTGHQAHPAASHVMTPVQQTAIGGLATVPTQVVSIPITTALSHFTNLATLFGNTPPPSFLPPTSLDIYYDNLLVNMRNISRDGLIKLKKERMLVELMLKLGMVLPSMEKKDDIA